MSADLKNENFSRLAARGAIPTGPDGKASEAATRAAELLRVLQAPPPRLAPSARARIAARLAEEAPPRELPHHRRVWWPAFGVAALVLFVGGAVGAAWGLESVQRLGITQKLMARWRHTEGAPVRLAPAPRALPAALVTPPAIEPAPVATTFTTTVLDPAPARATRKRRAMTLAEVAPVALVQTAPAAPAAHVEVAPPEEPVVAESRLLAEALTALRQRREPARALRALDEYEQRFPSGVLAPEASAARIDALLALGRRGQALERLEVLSLERLPRAAELRVLRGELRAGRGAVVGAASDFGAVLGMAGAPASVIERALYGRGSCRARLGDTAGARADLEEYLRRFPQGQFAGPAGRALRD